MEEEKEFDCSYQENVVCPYCGVEDGDSFEIGEKDDYTHCGSCGKKIAIEQEFSRHFSSSKTCQGPADHEWVSMSEAYYPGLFRCKVCSTHKQEK